MNYWFHSEAAAEHAEQVAFYEARQVGLGRRYHMAFRTAITAVCAAPDRYRVVLAPSIRDEARDVLAEGGESFARPVKFGISGSDCIDRTRLTFTVRRTARRTRAVTRLRRMC